MRRTRFFLRVATALEGQQAPELHLVVPYADFTLAAATPLPPIVGHPLVSSQSVDAAFNISRAQSWKRRTRMQQCAARWAFRHALPLQTALQEEVFNQAHNTEASIELGVEAEAHVSVAFNEQTAFSLDEDLFPDLLAPSASTVLEQICAPSPRRQGIHHIPDKQSQKRRIPEEDVVATRDAETCAAPDVGSSVVPLASADASGAASSSVVKLDFAFTPLLEGIFARSARSPLSGARCCAWAHLHERKDPLRTLIARASPGLTVALSLCRQRRTRLHSHRPRRARSASGRRFVVTSTTIILENRISAPFPPRSSEGEMPFACG